MSGHKRSPITWRCHTLYLSCLMTVTSDALNHSGTSVSLVLNFNTLDSQGSVLPEGGLQADDALNPSPQQLLDTRLATFRKTKQ